MVTLVTNYCKLMLVYAGQLTNHVLMPGKKCLNPPEIDQRKQPIDMASADLLDLGLWPHDPHRQQLQEMKAVFGSAESSSRTKHLVMLLMLSRLCYLTSISS